MRAWREAAIPFDVLELVKGGRANDAEFASHQDWLYQCCEIHCAAGRSTRPDRGMYFIDEQDW